MMQRRGTTRRQVIGGIGVAGASLLLPWGGARLTRAQSTPVALAAQMTIDLASEPPTLDPALVYDADGWSVVHSVYDSLVQYGSGGDLQPLLAESMTALDDKTFEVKLRQGITFHNGEPLDAAAVAFSVAHIQDPATKSQVAQNFGVIEQVEEVDPLTVRLKLSGPAPWLPAQIAAWLCILPPKYAGDPKNDFANNPVGTGPYRFVKWERGSRIDLEANADYFAASPKGRPTAAKVAFRPVTEGSTRVADLLAGSADLIRSVPVDQIAAVDQGGEVIAEPISGCAWVRIPTDVAPFDDVRVRQALNYAVDVDAIIQALLGGNGQRLANFFVPGGLGHDPGLKAYPHDPEMAKGLLAQAGFPDGFDTKIAVASTERQEIVQAVAGQLAEVGVRAEVVPTEIATFNAQWTDKDAPPLRYATWRPMFDPYTLLSLVVSGKGFLSRYDNPNAQQLLDAAAVDPSPDGRAKTYRELGRVLRDEPAAIYLHRLTSLYGIRKGTPRWTPRPDDYIIPTVVE